MQGSRLLPVDSNSEACDGEYEGGDRKADSGSRKRASGDVDKEGHDQGGDGVDQAVVKTADSAFAALPDTLHRFTASFLTTLDLGQATSVSRSLCPLYRTGVQELLLSLYHKALTYDELASVASLARLLSSLTSLRSLRVIGDRGATALASAASAAAAMEVSPLWLATLEEVVFFTASTSFFVECPQLDLRWAGDEGVSEEGHAAMLELLGLLAQGVWPRLKRLTLTGRNPTPFELRLRAVVQALEARSAECDTLQELRLTWGEKAFDTRLSDDSLVRRLLASPSCRALKAFYLGARISLSASCMTELVSYLRSPRSRHVRDLAFRWIPRIQENITDPAMLVTALADGCPPALRKLEMSFLLPKSQHVSVAASSALQSWAAGPFSRELEVFKCRVTPGMLEPLMEGVRIGHGFQRLRSVHLYFDPPDLSSINQLCQTMEVGAMPRLESLMLQRVDGNGLLRLMASLSHPLSTCSQTITLLYITECSASDEEGEAVGKALARGACPGLRKLELTQGWEFGDRTAASIADALRGGAVKRLELIGLDESSMGDDGFMAFKSVMEEGGTGLKQVSFVKSKVSGVRGRAGLMHRGPRCQGGRRKVLEGEEVEQRRARMKERRAVLARGKEETK